MSSFASTIQKALLPLGFLVLGGVGFGAVMSLSATVEKSDAERPPTPVEVWEAAPGDHTVVIEGTGTMQPSAQVDIVPQVQGKIVAVADGLTPGMAFDKGGTIARIDARDYQANLVQAQSNLEAAKLELQLEQSRGTQAQREWDLLGRDGTNPLALRQPQLAATQARVDGAQAQVDVARLALERTRLVAPFDAVVLSESLELGQFVAPGAPVARLMGTEKFRIRVSLPVDEATLVDIPNVNAEEGSAALVSQRLLDGSRLTVRGTVQRLLGELDPETRTATLLVQVLDPFDRSDEGSLPILPNAYVDVAITGRTLQGVVPVPRSALIEGRKVWVANAEDVLDQRSVTVAHAGRDTAFLRDGLQEGDRVVVSPLSLPVIGMKLDVRDTVATN